MSNFTDAVVPIKKQTVYTVPSRLMKQLRLQYLSNCCASLLTRIKSTGGPNPLAYNLPTTEEEWNQMLKKLEECGVDRAKAIEILRERREKFIQACSIHFS